MYYKGKAQKFAILGIVYMTDNTKVYVLQDPFMFVTTCTGFNRKKIEITKEEFEEVPSMHDYIGEQLEQYTKNELIAMAITGLEPVIDLFIHHTQLEGYKALLSTDKKLTYKVFEIKLTEAINNATD